MSVSLRVAVGIVTIKRADVLRETLRELGRQSIAPARVVVCYVNEGDVAGSAEGSPLANGAHIEFVASAPGIAVQRNAIMDRLDDCDIVIFFDDDFFACPTYAEVTEHIFRSHPKIIITTGNLIADGIKTPGISFEEARRLIAANGTPIEHCFTKPVYNGYGCNMAVRLSVVREHSVRFDERLALYGWYEDIDFNRRLSAYGDIVELSAARGVHLGTKMGRSPGRQLGYSQVVNPIYLARKGSYARNRAAVSIAKNVAANISRSFWPEPWVDRRGRLGGNLLGFRHLASGRCTPEYILELSNIK
jgi:GT2 family glycosyltransferase